jgi:hypothetical protein
LHDCREAGGRTTQGAVVEEQISAHAVVFVKEGEQSACDSEQTNFREVIGDRILKTVSRNAPLTILNEYNNHRS